jgi:hypothetical protein
MVSEFVVYLKIKGLNMTTSVVLCLILKLFLGLNKMGTKGLDKNLNFCPSLNHTLQELHVFPTNILVGTEPNFVGIVAFPTTVPTKWFVGIKAAIPTHYLRKFVGTVCQPFSYQNFVGNAF